MRRAPGSVEPAGLGAHGRWPQMGRGRVLTVWLPERAGEPATSSGSTTVRLHRRHLSSTPAGTRRATRLPQRQRHSLGSGRSVRRLSALATVPTPLAALAGRPRRSEALLKLKVTFNFSGRTVRRAPRAVKQWRGVGGEPAAASAQTDRRATSPWHLPQWP